MGKGNKIEDVFHVDYAHNGYLDQYLNMGWIGVLLFAGMLYAAGRNATSHFTGGSILGFLFMSFFGAACYLITLRSLLAGQMFLAF